MSTHYDDLRQLSDQKTTWVEPVRHLTVDQWLFEFFAFLKLECTRSASRGYKHGWLKMDHVEVNHQELKEAIRARVDPRFGVHIVRHPDTWSVGLSWW